MDLLNLQQVNPQGFDQAGGQHGHTVLRSFAIAHYNFQIFKIHIFDSQAHTFHQPQPAAIEQARDQVLHPGHLIQHALYFCFGQHGGQAFGLPGADGFEIERIKFLAQHFAVEKEQRAEGLGLRGGSDMLLNGKVGEEGADFGHTHLAGMAFIVEENETFDPLNVALFGAVGIMLDTQGLAYLVEKFFLWRHRLPHNIIDFLYVLFYNDTEISSDWARNGGELSLLYRIMPLKTT